MLRKTKNAGIYKSGQPAGEAVVHTFTHEGTTRLLPAAQKTAEAADQIKRHSIGASSNANRLRGGQWRHTW